MSGGIRTPDALSNGKTKQVKRVATTKGFSSRIRVE